MGNASRAVLGVLFVVVGLAGCGAQAATSVVSAQERCERSRGIWRPAVGICETSGGGGGGY